MAYGVVATDTITSSTGQTFSPASGSATMKNRIINGDMRIDQRNAGANTTPNSGNTYTVDRWFLSASQNTKFTVGQNLNSVSLPTGFSKYLGASVASAYTSGSSDYFSLSQNIEGFNIADLGWGTATAKSVTLSFWVYSSLTGTFSAAVQNSGASRSYPFTYSVSTANTWTQISVIIPGDTTGTWLTTNGTGISLNFNLGSGSSLLGTAGLWSGNWYIGATGANNIVANASATFYITGVQFEQGPVATSFDFRHYGQELALCQRYYEKSYAQGTVPGTVTDTGRMVNVFGSLSTAYIGGFILYKVTKRVSGTPTVYNPANGTSGQIATYNFGSVTNNTAPTVTNANDTGFVFYYSGVNTNGYGVHYTTDAEL